MKKAFLLLFLFSSFFADAQSLKEALFSGKLKSEPGSVIRKGDDLSAKMDTATRKTSIEDTLGATAAVLVLDSAAGSGSTQTGSVVAAKVDSNSSVATAATASEDTSAAVETAEISAEPAVAPKDNNAIWKDYMKSLSATLKTEVLSSKKVKKGSYYVLVSYAIGTDGEVTITDVFVSPENSFLQQQVKDRIALEAPKLNPVLNSAGVARKVNKKYNFTLEKE